MEQGNGTCISLHVLQRGTRTGKRAHNMTSQRVRARVPSKRVPSNNLVQLHNGQWDKAMAHVCHCSSSGELLAQASVHAIDQRSPGWWDAQAVRMGIKLGGNGHCNATMGNRTRQWHLHVAARSPASRTCTQTQTRVAITHKACVPKLHTTY